MNPLDTTPQIQPTLTVSDVSFETFKDEWLSDVRRDAPSTVELGRRFAHKIVSQWKGLDEASESIIYCDGSGDGGIDLAALETSSGPGDERDDNVSEGDTWYLIQSKYGTALQGSETILAEGFKVIETLEGHRTRLSSLAEGLLERLTNFRRAHSDQDRIVLVFATEEPLNEAERRALGDLREMGRQRLGSYFEVDAVSVFTIYEQTLEEMASAQTIILPLKADLPASGHELVVGAVSLLDIYAFLKAYRDRTEELDRLYERNVRQFQGLRGRVNKAMFATLQNMPERFGLYNNGITFVVEDFTSQGDGTILLTEPHIVNGCQTTRTIWEACERRLNAGGTGVDPELETWRQKASQSVVVTKIVKVGTSGDELLRDITRYTNSQNAVREKDFLTLNRDFKSWQKQMEDLHGVYLEIQRGGWDSRRALQRQKLTLNQLSKAANAFDLLKVYGAGWLSEAGTAFGKNPPFLPDGAIFKAIMSADAEGEAFDVSDLTAAYRLMTAADSFNFGRGGPVPRRQTRFLFYMVVIELLRDVMTRSGIQPITNKKVSNAVNTLFAPEHEAARQSLLDIAVQVIDEYMTQGSEDSIFDEPAYKNTFNQNLNSYLKWEKLGKNDVNSPKFRSLLSDHKRTMGRSVGGVASPRDVIGKALTS